jgi:hypothetical protein
MSKKVLPPNWQKSLAEGCDSFRGQKVSGTADSSQEAICVLWIWRDCSSEVENVIITGISLKSTMDS